MSILIQVAITAFLIIVWVYACFYRYGTKKAASDNYYRVDIVDYFFASIMGSIIMGAFIPPLLQLFYQDFFGVLLFVISVFAGAGLLYAAKIFGEKHGTRKVEKQESLKEENARLQAIIKEHLDPVDHTVSGYEIAARAKKKAPRAPSVGCYKESDLYHSPPYRAHEQDK